MSEMHACILHNISMSELCACKKHVLEHCIIYAR